MVAHPLDWNPRDHGHEVTPNHGYGEHDKPGCKAKGELPRQNMFLRREDMGKAKPQTMDYRYGRDDKGNRNQLFDEKIRPAADTPASNKSTIAQGGEGYQEYEAKRKTKGDENPKTDRRWSENVLDKKGLSFGGKGRSLLDGPKYGNFGGKNYTGGEGGDEFPLDSSDRMYMQHDAGWADCESRSPEQRGLCKEKENERLVNRLEYLSDEPAEWPYPPPRALRNDAKWFRKGAIRWFKK